MSDVNEKTGIAAIAQVASLVSDAAPASQPMLRRKVAKVDQVTVDDASSSIPIKRFVGRPRKTVAPISVAAAAAKPTATKRVAKVVPKPTPKPIQATHQAPRRSAPVLQSRAAPSSAFSIKDLNMDMSANFSGFQDAIAQAQAKAQAAFEKSSAAFGEAGEFAKGNVEALVESGKILAEGAQAIGNTFAAEGRTAFDTMTGDIKELAAAKSPVDFFKLQNEIARKSLDNVAACSSKNTETFLKLMSDAFSPLSGRINLAVEKARQVSPMSAGWNKAA